MLQSLAIHSDEIPRHNTPRNGTSCGYTTLPPPILNNCTDPIKKWIPNMTGDWAGIVEGTNRTHWERIEQCSDRVVITSAGVIHDFPHADGTLEHGVRNDVGGKTIPRCVPIPPVAGSFDGDCFKLRPLRIATLVTRCLNHSDGTLTLHWANEVVSMKRV